MRKEWKKPVASALVLALALANMTVSGTETKAASTEVKLAETAASGSAVSGTSADPLTTGPLVTTGSAVTPDSPAGRLNAAIDKFDEYMWTLTGGDRVRVQSSELAAPEIQNYAFAQSMLRKKNKKVKVNVDYDLGNDGSSELFALYPNGNLEIYTYDMKMSGNFMKDVKPTAKIKGVKEVRVKNVKKGLVAIKTKKGKIVVYKYTFVKAKKKGSISKKAFKKLKKKVTFEKLRSGIDSIYSETTMLYAAENFYLDEHYHDEEKYTSKYIARYDKEDKENPYKLFFERHSDDGDFNTSGRVILGPDEAADWKADVQKYDTIKNAVPILGYAYAGKDVKVTEELKTLKGTASTVKVYDIMYDYGDGTDGDTYFKVFIDESGSVPKFQSVETVASVGVITERVDFYYGAAADYDGEMYTPGLEQEVYASPDFIKATGLKERKVTVDFAGTKKTFTTLENSHFEFFSSTGTFYLIVDGKETELGTGNSDEAAKIINLISPIDGTADPSVQVVWRANALK